MLSGNFSAQILSLLFYPILVRIFSPYDFGIAGTFSSFMVVFSIFASGQLHMAFVKAKDQNQLSELYWLFKKYCLVGTFISMALLLIINLKFQILPSTLILLFPLSLISYLGFESNKMLGIREENFKLASQANASTRLGSNIFKVLLGKITASYQSLIIADIIANTFSYLFFKNKFKTKSIKPQNAKALLKEFSHFPLYASFSILFQVGLIEFPVIFLAGIYGSTQVGIYVLSLRILLQPLTVIGNSLGSVISNKLVKSHAQKISSKKILFEIYALFLATGLIIFGVVWLIPEDWYLVILGQKWSGFKAIILPVSLLSAAKLSSGLHIWFYVANGQMWKKTVWKALQLGLVIFLIFHYSNLPLETLMWIICITEASVDFLFTLFTVATATQVQKLPKDPIY